MDRRQQIRFLRLEHLERPTHTTATVAIIWEAQKESIDYLEKSRGGWSGRGSCRRRGTSVAEAGGTRRYGGCDAAKGGTRRRNKARYHFI